MPKKSERQSVLSSLDAVLKQKAYLQASHLLGTAAYARLEVEIQESLLLRHGILSTRYLNSPSKIPKSIA